MTFKEKLVILRKARGLTQDDFASAVGVSRQAVYKWESGQSYPEVPKLLEIKMLFNISIDELLDDSFDIPVPEKKKRKRAPKAASAPKPVSTPKAEPVKPVAPVAQPAPAPAPKAEPVKPVAPVAQPAPAPAPKAEPVKPAAPVAQPAPAPTPKAEPVKPVAPVAQPAPAPAPKAEPEVKPEPKIDSVPSPTEIDLEDLQESDENTKKVGFFGRLFGKR